MTVHTILKMGDPRLLRHAQPVTTFDTPELHQLVVDLQDTMAAAQGAGLAAPQIGVDLQVVLFGSGLPNPRYPDAPPVPRTVLINPVITPLGDEEEEDWEGCLSVPGMRGVVPRWRRIRYQGFDEFGRAIEALAIPHDLPKPGSSISVSIGLATLRPTMGSEPLSLVIKADEGLYLAKHSGRNCVAQVSDDT